MFNPKDITISFTKESIKQINSYKQKRDDDYERGGILMGELYPDDKKIVISQVICTNADTSSRYGLEIDVNSAQKYITEIWKKTKGKTTYLGDWHSHPENIPFPSFTDKITFVKNYFGSTFSQKILIYVIIGNNNKKHSNMWIGVCSGIKINKVKAIVNQ